jgi:tellurite resistance protein TerA
VNTPSGSATSQDPVRQTGVVQLSPGANTEVPSSFLEVTLSWRPVPGVDADLMALLCTGRRVRSDDDFVFSDQPADPAGRVHHVGKSADGTRARDVLTVDLATLERDVDLVVVAASLDAADGQGFGALAVAALALGIGDLVTLPLPHLTSQRALVVAEFYRRGAGWKVRAVGQGHDDGLAGLARDFGVRVDEAGRGPTTGPAWDWRDPPVPAGYGG